MFPLVPRVVRVLQELYECKSYCALVCAAEAGCASVVDWILRHRGTRNFRKECISVMTGLCAGGHLDMAKNIADGDRVGIHCIPSIAWPPSAVGDDDFVDEVRESSILEKTCGNGHMRVAQWVIDRFRVSEAWEFIKPFLAALTGGQLDIAKWLTTLPAAGLNENFPLLNQLGYLWIEAAYSGSPAIAKWCSECIKAGLELECPPDASSCCSSIQNLEAERILQRDCRPFSSQVAGRFIPGQVVVNENKPHTGANTRVNAPFIGEQQRQHCFVVGCNFPGADDRIDGLEWFLKRIPLYLIEESSIAELLATLDDKYLVNNALLVLERFHLPIEKYHELIFNVLLKTVQTRKLDQVKKVISLGDFQKSSIAQCLTRPGVPKSSRTVKWLITHYNLNHHDVSLNDNMLLYGLITSNRRSCAEWLITNFGISMDEMIGMMYRCKPVSHSSSDFNTWKMILRLYPTITRSVVLENFMVLATRSPLCAELTMRKCSLSFDQISTFCSADVTAYGFPIKTRLWLQTLRRATTDNQQTRS
ncbi:hypothetical protein Pelo_18612 [Pelomyxa schiedti]|nr:hypothetical protein Pelo_18612 [Pelomyxa schiedti]